MKKNNSTIIWVIVVGVVLVILFVLPKLKSPNQPGVPNTGVPCLVPNVSLTQHIHPQLTIDVDGVQETIPANIGLGACERAVHTHDDTYQIHVESQDTRQYTLGDFMSVWGKTFNRDGYNLETTVDGQLNQDPAGILFKDGQQIVMNYKKI